MELRLTLHSRYAYLLYIWNLYLKTFFLIVLNSQDLPDLPPLDADQIVRDAANTINGELIDAKLDYIRRRKIKMNIFKRVRFALKRNSDLERLAVEMERYINALMKMCSPHVARVRHR
jgi:hypothetical protein